MNDESDKNKMFKSGVVFEIERYAIHDGPGIRTVVFLKGCPLGCLWCANPESQSSKKELIYWKDKCLGCERCINICPYNALSLTADGININRDICRVCGKCADVCNAEAMVVVGKSMTSLEILDEILKDEMFYKESGGGVTFSGGEPFMQHELLLETALLCKKNYIHTCMETCGYIKWEFMKEIVPYIDLFLYDFKIMSSKKHKDFTGVSNQLILDNFKRLVDLNKDVIIRVPVIPGVNDIENNLNELVEFLKRYAPGNRVDLLPYHRLGAAKYPRLDKKYELEQLLPPSKEELESIKKFFQNNCFTVSIGG